MAIAADCILLQKYWEHEGSLGEFPFATVRRARFGDPPAVTRFIQAALLAAILWVVEVCTSKVRISGSVSRRGRTIS